MASRVGLNLSLRRKSRQKSEDAPQAEQPQQNPRSSSQTDRPPATQDVAKVEAPKQKQKVVILVMGPTGVGKSTFINLASNSDLRVSNSLISCTEHVELSKPFDLDGMEVTLVDTPGFDDTSKSESDVLNVVCEYLATEYSQGRRLHGVLYLYRISDNRVSGAAARNLRFYRELCGPSALPNSIIVTNFWGVVDAATGAAREEELKTKPAFFKPALDAGARLWRHDGTVPSAHRILRQLVHAAPCTLQVQRELIDEGRAVYATAAGEALLAELARAAQKHAQEMAQLEEDLADARREQDEEAQRELEEERARILAEQAKLDAEKQKLMQLHVSAARMRAEHAAVERAQAEAQARAEAAEKERLEGEKQRLAKLQAAAEQARAAQEQAQAQAQAQAAERARIEEEKQRLAQAQADAQRARIAQAADEQAEAEARAQALRSNGQVTQETQRQTPEPAETRAPPPTQPQTQAPPDAAVQPAPQAERAADTSPPPKAPVGDAEHGGAKEVGPSAGCFGALAALFRGKARAGSGKTQAKRSSHSDHAKA